MFSLARLVGLCLCASTVVAFAPVPQTRRTMVAPLQMANNAGAKKRILTGERNRVINAAWRSRVRTWTKKTAQALDKEDVVAARECARMATSMIDRATRRNIYHKNWAARNKSKLSKKVIALILKTRGIAPTAPTDAVVA
ncbi:ribosomal protein S20 [Pelagophyceae sp. CCMP2097]|nr:ribosomal protein S20 [Pelagophyceae sp. CCMP2097]|mmetsp:Transcript_14894/g.49902  ORF Transcript_14894/g.49902 Transcript_14894/m.49902 type:complete len:140 (+) Transcript_14894:37-456(+)